MTDPEAFKEVWVCSGCGNLAGFPHHCMAIPWDGEGWEPCPVWVPLSQFDPNAKFIQLFDGSTFDVEAWEAANGA